MPTIRQYTPQIGGLDLNDRASSSAVATGRHIAGAYDTMASAATTAANAEASVIGKLGDNLGRTIAEGGKVIVDYFSTQTKIKKGKEFADKTIELTLKLNEFMNDPANRDDPQRLAKFRASVLEPALEEYSKGTFTEEGRDWTQNRVNAMRNHFLEKAIGDEATQAGQRAATALETLKGKTAAGIAADPTLLKLGLDNLDATAAALARIPGINNTTAGALITTELQKQKKDLVDTSILTMARKNPAALIASIESGQFAKEFGQYVGGDTHKYRNVAETFLKMAQEQDRLNATENRRKAKQASDTAQSALIMEMWDPNTNQFSVGPKTMDKVASLLTTHKDAVGRDDALGLINAVRSLQHSAVNDPDTLQDLNARLREGRDPNNPRALNMDALNAAKAARRIDNETYSFYIGVLTKPDGPKEKLLTEMNELIDKGFKSSITKTTSLVPGIPEQDRQYAAFLTEARRRFDVIYKADGYAAAQAMFTDTKNPNYIGKIASKYVIDAPEHRNMWTDRVLTGPSEFTPTDPSTLPPVRLRNGNVVQPGETNYSISVEDKPVPPRPRLERTPDGKPKLPIEEFGSRWPGGR